MGRALLAALGLVSALVVGGCGDGESEGAGSSGDPGPLHGCADGDFVEATEITFEDIEYTPPCARVGAGGSITYKGEFSAHNLQGGTVENGSGTPDDASPIRLMTTGTEASVTFSTAGTFPYYCVQHQGVGMVGVVRVE